MSARLVAPGRSSVDYQAEADRCATTGEKDSQQKNEDCLTTSTNNFVPNITHDNRNVTNIYNNSVAPEIKLTIHILALINEKN